MNYNILAIIHISVYNLYTYYTTIINRYQNQINKWLTPQKMMTTTRKEYILEDFIEAVTGMNLTNVRSAYLWKKELIKRIESLNKITE